MHKIFLIINETPPDFLNVSNERLVIVKHRDYISEEYLPTFSANVIEDNMYRIDGLSDTFVYFNDDFFLNKDVLPCQFFVDGLPCYLYMQSFHKPYPRGKRIVSATDMLIHNDIIIINRNFSRFSQSWRLLVSGKILSDQYNLRWHSNFGHTHLADMDVKVIGGAEDGE